MPCHFDGSVPISPVAKATCSAFFCFISPLPHSLAHTHTPAYTRTYKIVAVVNSAAIVIVVAAAVLLQFAADAVIVIHLDAGYIH